MDNSPVVTNRAVARRGTPNRSAVNNAALWGTKNLLFSRYGGPVAFSALGPLMGQSVLQAGASGLGYFAAQGMYDAGSFVGKKLGGGLTRAGKGLGALHGKSVLPMLGGKMARGAGALLGMSTYRNARAIGGSLSNFGSRLSKVAMPSTSSMALRGAGAVATRIWGPMMLASFATMLLPETSAVREVGEYIMGNKAADWFAEKAQMTVNDKKGGFGLAKTPVGNGRTMQAQDLALQMLGMSAQNSMLGREAQFMHN